MILPSAPGSTTMRPSGAGCLAQARGRAGRRGRAAGGRRAGRRRRRSRARAARERRRAFAIGDRSAPALERVRRVTSPRARALVAPYPDQNAARSPADCIGAPMSARHREAPPRPRRRAGYRSGWIESALASAPGTRCSRARRARAGVTARSPRLPSGCPTSPSMGFRRAVPAADPSHRAHLPQGQEQPGHGDARRTWAAPGRSAVTRAVTRAFTPSSARSRISTTSRRRRRGTGSRSRSTSRCRSPPTILTSRSTPSGSSVDRTVPSSTRRTHRRSIRISTRSTSSAKPGRASGSSSGASSSSGQARGVRIFRVDNPHTKSLPFWRWCIAELTARHPDTLFLAEAFTRPKLMYAAREDRLHAVVHVLHLAPQRPRAQPSTCARSRHRR